MSSAAPDHSGSRDDPDLVNNENPEDAAPNPPKLIDGKTNSQEHARARMSILAIVLIMYAIAVLYPLIILVRSGHATDPEVDHLVTVIAATVGPIIGFYFARADGPSNRD